MFEQRLRIGLAHTDAAGVIFAPRLFELTQLLYETFLADNGLSLRELLQQGLGLPIVHLEADYLSPMRLGDELTAQLQLERLGTSSFTLSCHFRHNEMLVATTRTIHVAVYQGDKSPLPPLVIDLLKRLAK